MIKSATIKKFGDKGIRAINIKLPDSITCLDEYKIEIIEFDTIGKPEAAIFIVKDNIDYDSETIQTNIKDSFKYGIKRIIDRLTDTTKLLSSAPL